MTVPRAVILTDGKIYPYREGGIILGIIIAPVNQDQECTIYYNGSVKIPGLKNGTYYRDNKGGFTKIAGTTLLGTCIDEMFYINIQSTGGTKGDKGDTGAQGIQGLQGEQGFQGIQGIQGQQGIPGTTDYNELINKPDLSSLHSHDNKALLDTYAQTEANLADAVAKKHNTHAISDITGLQTALDNKEPANANIQAHISSAHAPSNAQKNSDILKSEIEAKLIGEISTHTHAGGGGGLSHQQVLARGLGC